MYYTRAIKAVRDAGLDPNIIAITGLDIDGYNEMVLDSEGKKVFDHRKDGVKKVRKEWPSRSVGIAVVDALIRDKREFGEIG